MRSWLILGAVLVACSNPIFGVSIQDISVNVPAATSGTMWLGFEITEGFSASMTVKLSELVADVTIL